MTEVMSEIKIAWSNSHCARLCVRHVVSCVGCVGCSHSSCDSSVSYYLSPSCLQYLSCCVVVRCDARITILVLLSSLLIPCLSWLALLPCPVTLLSLLLLCIGVDVLLNCPQGVGHAAKGVRAPIAVVE